MPAAEPIVDTQTKDINCPSPLSLSGITLESLPAQPPIKSIIQSHQLPIFPPPQPTVPLVIYNFAFGPPADFNTTSALVAFITSPLTFNFPLMNSFCAFAFPATNFPKSSSDKMRVTSDLATPSGFSPLPTAPVVLRSTNQDSVSPAEFLSVKVKIPLAWAMACFLAGSDWREAARASKMAEAGKAAVVVGG